MFNVMLQLIIIVMLVFIYNEMKAVKFQQEKQDKFNEWDKAHPWMRRL